MSDKQQLSVFIASPGDLVVERRKFRECIDALNCGFGDGARVVFEALGWEDTLASTGPRSQSVINAEIDRCDVFILAMHRRWGQEAPDAKPYSSYTEEEFHRALEKWKKEKKPEIFVFFKHVDPASMADPGPQLTKVLEFRQELEKTRQVFHRPFADGTEFRDEVDRHLRAFAKGELPKPDAEPNVVVLPVEAVREVEQAKKRAQKEAERAEQALRQAEAAAARSEELALRLSEQAAAAALEGKIEEARQSFSKATNGTTSLRVLYLAFDFYIKIGETNAAKKLCERWQAIGDPDSDSASAEVAAAHGNRSLIDQTRGDLGGIGDMLKTLSIAEEQIASSTKSMDRSKISEPLQNYEIFGDKILAPEPYLWIPVSGSKGYRKVHFFVDSGSPITVIPDFIADGYHIAWDKKKNRNFTGPQGVRKGYLNEIKVEICTEIRNIPCLVFESSDRARDLSILGRAGVFDFFKIQFLEGLVQIEPH